MIGAAPATRTADTSLSLRSVVEKQHAGDSTTCTITFLLTLEGNGHERVNLEVDYYEPGSEQAAASEASTVRVNAGEETPVLSWTVTGTDVNGYHATVTAAVVGKKGHAIAPVSEDGTCDGLVVVTE